MKLENITKEQFKSIRKATIKEVENILDNLEPCIGDDIKLTERLLCLDESIVYDKSASAILEFSIINFLNDLKDPNQQEES